MQPVIGITPSPTRDTLSHGTFDRYVVSANYVNAVLAAGGIPIVLPPQDDHTSPLLDRIHGLLLSGGADIDPAAYGESEPHSATYGVHPLRDRFEFALLREALARELPILCICRGIQVLNVALGGTLYQDIADQYGRQINHRQEELGIDAAEPGHQVAITPGSVLEEIVGRSALGVNSFHHQAIKTVAPELEVAGRAEDGLVEAVALPGPSFVLGVQWHPELMCHRHPAHLALFERLVAAARSLTAAWA